ncbi:MAG: redoxin domain-containing protein [Bacteroidales bacterium]|nr:redoxin domain-containing protein [Bacteroidales bacterium]
MMKTRTLLTALLLCCTVSFLSGQTDACVGGLTQYNITLKNIPFQGKVYLRSCHLDTYEVIDSAVVKKGKAKLRNTKEWFPDGLYTIVNEDHSYRLPVLLDTETSFTIVLPTQTGESVSVIGSEKNEELQEFIRKMSLGKVSPQDVSVALETSPDSYLTRVKAILYFTHYKQLIDTSFFTLWSRWYNFQDARSLHTSPYFFRTLSEYLSDYDVTIEDKNYVIDHLLAQCNLCSRDEMVSFIFNTINDLRDPYYDPLLVHLYDDYSRTWVPEDRERLLKRKMDRIRKIIPGAKIPELVSHDIEGKAHSTKEISTRYTVLWFWDPDCDHCQVMTPQLHEMYQRLDTLADFEVFAVEVNEDYDRWKAFSDEHQLWDWINLSTSMGEANIDFIEYFDIMTTPVIFLIDNTSSAIIARQITLEELETFFKQHPKI